MDNQQQTQKPVNKTKRIIEILVQIIGFLVIVFIIIFGTSYASHIGDKEDIGKIPTSTIYIPDINVDTTTIDPSQGQTTSTIKLNDWQLFNSYKKVVIYPKGIDTPSDYVQNASQALSKAGRQVKVEGIIEDAYIYIKAGANDIKGNFTSIDPQYDGIWFYRKDGQFNGGLLDLTQSRRGEPTKYTELLYNLKSIPLASNNQDYRQNRFSSINVLEHFADDANYFAALVSTARYARIMDFEIGYKCFVSSTCSITPVAN